MTQTQRKVPIDLAAVIAARISERSPEAAQIDTSLTNVITLRVQDDCSVYERNPRSVRNEKYDEIKESIRKRGVDQMISVTQRPGEKQYFPAKGGNTRLQIVQELAAEGLSQFQRMDFIFVPYRGEASLLAAHMVENDQRSGLNFWDAARSTFELKAALESEQGDVLSLREFSDYLKKTEGLQASPALLSHYGFALKHLTAIACAAGTLSRRDVQDRFIPARTRVTALANRLDAATILEEAWAAALDELRESYVISSRLDIAIFVARLEDAFLRGLGLVGGDLTRLEQYVQENEKLGAAALLSQFETGGNAIHERASLADVGGANAFPAVTKAHSTAAPKPEIVDGTAPSNSIICIEPTAKPRTLDGLAISGFSDIKKLLWDALNRFVAANDLLGCIVNAPKLRYGFMAEVPLDAGDSVGSLQDQGLDSPAAAERYYAWWWLVLLSEQNTSTSAERLPESRFKHYISTPEAWQKACECVIGDPVLADGSYHVVRRMTDATDLSGAEYLRVIGAIRAFDDASRVKASSEPPNFDPTAG